MRHTEKKRALVTILIGDAYSEFFNRYIMAGWQQYGRLHNYDIIVFRSPLDSSSRAAGRSPAWQKCIVGEHSLVQQYEQVVWLDADIFINPVTSPSIAESVPLELVGAINDRTYPTADMHQMVQKRIAAIYGSSDQETRYGRRGLPMEHQQDVQTGVLVFSPRRHQSLLRQVYDRYEDSGDPRLNYEMFFLSHELLIRPDVLKWLDVRFNATVWYDILLYHPYLLDKIAETTGVVDNDALKSFTISNILSMNYFAHFAGIQPMMKYIDNAVLEELSCCHREEGRFDSETFWIG